MLERFFKMFPPPRFLDLPRVGLDISDEAVRFVELVPTTWGVSVGKWGEVALPRGIVESGHINDPERLKRVLALIKDEYKFKYITASLPEEKVYLYKTTIPIVERHEIRNAIEFTLEENVPLHPDSTVFTYKVIKKDEEKGVMEVSVGVLPDKVVQMYFDVFQSVGLIPLDFHIEGIAITNAVIGSDDMGTNMVVNFTERSTGVYIASEGVVRFTSTLPLGGDALTTALQKTLGISFEEAQRIKRQEEHEGNKKAGKELFGYSMNTLSAIKDELLKIITYWSTHDSVDKTIEKIIVCGEDSAIIGLDKYLTLSLKIPAKQANVWGNAFSFDRYIPPIECTESLNFSVPIGLALSSLKSHA